MLKIHHWVHQLFPSKRLEMIANGRVRGGTK